MQRLLLAFSTLSGVLLVISVLAWLDSYSTSYELEVRFARADGAKDSLARLDIMFGELKLSDERHTRPGRWTYDSITWQRRKFSYFGPPPQRPPLFPTHFAWRTRGQADDLWQGTWPVFHTVAPLWSFALVFMIGAGIWPLVALRRVRRRRKGRCSQCGYDLTGNVSGRCPECGSTVAREGRAPQSA
jgi:predicted RNA-binding Zn-ribbon protein involved in translation (DUF1610 family)